MRLSPYGHSWDWSYRQLAEADPVLASLIDACGDADPFEGVGRLAGEGPGVDTNFAALVLHILGQQISVRAAFATCSRLQTHVGDALATEVLSTISEQTLRGLGLSRQKARSISDLAERHVHGRLDVEHMTDLDDAAAVRALTAVRGIGRWAAEMFLIQRLHRADVLLAGDAGVRKAVQRVYGFAKLPSEDRVRELGQAWAPYRTLATDLLWRSLPGRRSSADGVWRGLRRRRLRSWAPAGGALRRWTVRSRFGSVGLGQ